ncbi:MAG: permease-like cell division protein FtsX [Candidatus Marinimicrobia bacterium]|nr:permease-like cell division protein FtsX [Candidatus Neomarinimicrobiota bacterium]MDP6594160.1 permease-like cell division protein FtsX [Candidatus Neomarinimicrobiota bacterium]MDP6835638.1 permease-like cell division protein FtsX [Candidatus Neomarinimicrobiota bacterium]MDP6966873.1 permease-like cell division protein FtsX [Candidatus Neomarinimicrobiota bacterium]
MIDKILYLIAEGFRSLWRARLTAVASITAIGVSMSFVGFGAIIGQNFSDLIEFARSQYRFEVFFSPLISDSEAKKTVDNIMEIERVKSARLITKQEASEIFESEFGENIYDLLQENPLPASCVVKLEEEGEERLRVSPIIRQIRAMPDVSDVRYQGRIISLVEQYYQGFFAVVTALAVVVLLGTVLLISNTIRLTIYSRRDLIRILKLVGATDRFIRFPFLVEGIIEGVLGAFLASAVAYGFVHAGNYFLSLFVRYRLMWDMKIVAILVVVVVFFAIAGSLRSVRKFLV